MGEYYAIHQNDELKHYGVLGMKWGVRRYQNADGSLTPAGLKRDSRLREKTKKALEGSDIEEIKKAKDELLTKANELATKVYEEAAKANANNSDVWQFIDENNESDSYIRIITNDKKAYGIRQKIKTEINKSYYVKLRVDIDDGAMASVSVNQNGETLSKIKPIEGTMHINVSGTPLNPTAILEVPVEAITQNLNSFIVEE